MKENNTTSNSAFNHRLNNRIRVPQVRVIGSDGNQIGVLATFDALKLAQDEGLDLVEINPKTSPPVCKIIDYGKFKYEEKKKMVEARKNQKVVELKEITFRPKTDENDLQHKLQSARSFLADGNKVKFTVRFRGREVTHPQYAEEKLRWLVEQLQDQIGNSTQPLFEGKFMSLMVSPK